MMLLRHSKAVALYFRQWAIQCQPAAPTLKVADAVVPTMVGVVVAQADVVRCLVSRRISQDLHANYTSYLVSQFQVPARS